MANLTTRSSRRREAANNDHLQEWNSDDQSPASYPMELDDDDEQDDDNGEDVDDVESVEAKPQPPTRSLRPRSLRQREILGTVDRAVDPDVDELQDNSLLLSDPDDDNFAPLVTSDVLPSKPRRGPTMRRQQRSLRYGNRRSAQQHVKTRVKSPDSDIEFEAPRRSGRATRTLVSMRDDADGDEESFYQADDGRQLIDRVVSVREVFQPSDTTFSAVHMSHCRSCGQSRQREQLVHCQGCSFSYHKACLGTRSVRDHLVTKVGENDFVLQCKFCICIYQKRDPMAPRHSLCQGCVKENPNSQHFSERKTARQEEKMREENNGSDPITKVSPSRLNNTSSVFFRCQRCYRSWHPEHLPHVGGESVQLESDLVTERLKDYSVDWKCNECCAAKHKIHHLVAWRPTKPLAKGFVPDYSEVSEDEKKYLIKWILEKYR